MASLASIGYLFLIWKFASVLVVSDAVVVVGARELDPMVVATDKLVKAQSAIIETLKDTSAQQLHDRLTAVEEEFKKLNRLSDIGKGANDSCEVALQMLTMHYVSIDEQLKRLQALVKERTQQVDKKAIIGDIVTAIRSNYFKLAEEKLLQLGDLGEISAVVHEVYADSEDNFGAGVNLAKVLSKISASFEVLKALHHEMQVSGHQDPYKLIILAEALHNEVVKQHNDPDGVKASATSIINELVQKIKKGTTELLINVVTGSESQNQTDVHALVLAIDNFSPELSIEVIQLLVDDVYEKVETSKLLDFFSTAATAQAAFGIKTLFWKIKDDGKLHDSVILELASLLSKIQKRSEYHELTQAQQNDLDKIVDLLPTCAKSLYFSPTVCLWSKERTTYLEASNKSFAHDANRRNIFTLPPSNDSSSSALQDIPVGAPWIVHEIDGHVLFKSAKYTNEYLYVAEIIFNPEMRYVFTWVPGDNTDKQSFFSVELDGDFCYLKSTRSKQYLFPSDAEYWHKGGYSYVTVWTGSLSKDKSAFLWQIRKC